MRIESLCAIAWLVGCAGGQQTATSSSRAEAAPPPSDVSSSFPPRSPSCAQQTASLQDFVERLDRDDPTISEPWPTGDTARDHHIEEVLTVFRAAIKPEENGSHFLPLNMRNITPGELERLYEKCPASLTSLKAVEEASPKRRWKLWHQVVDGLIDCGCRADLAMLRVFYYLIYRGPYGSAHKVRDLAQPVTMEKQERVPPIETDDPDGVEWDPFTVAPPALEALRIAGGIIPPDDVTKGEIARSGKDKLVGTYRLCVTSEGDIKFVRVIKTSGFSAYDAKIQTTIRNEWRYRPFMINGKPADVCTVVSFIYKQGPPAVQK